MENLFQDIFDKLQEILPDEWDEMKFYIQYGKNHYSMRFYVRQAGGRYIDCYALPGLTVETRENCFMEIDEIVYPYWESLPDDHRWSVMTMIVDAEGDFRVEYDYTDISDEIATYFLKWKEKYLGKMEEK